MENFVRKLIAEGVPREIAVTLADVITTVFEDGMNFDGTVSVAEASVDAANAHVDAIMRALAHNVHLPYSVN